ncbi:MAG: TetR/AcrR family transcriptional regulator [Rhodospirillaceae bacterium]|jgi:TetR/AcrR family transcriptional regulator, transcriptional repressor for nem operon|nr:TetR/AcrR family transcriptional regulator [Rhodospirillaceae bacterium]MBT5666126.1 TetR/AcrR family transcriptional regulator [Rhodospirillaceae bacterium]MBT5809249.1 TetR/AcrR family transcriptional regulator [Rhodospirillaceae bacterium]
MNDVKERLIEAAQSLIQKRGYNGFSYRDIAAQIGIRSASIHYHFPTKADLGTAVVARYTDFVLESLRAAEQDTDDAARLLGVFSQLFRDTMRQDRRMCLCGMLGAEVDSLPDAVANETKRFFERVLEWLKGVLSRAENSHADRADTLESDAAAFLATLEGAMIVAKGAGNPELFDKIVVVALQRYQ